MFQRVNRDQLASPLGVCPHWRAYFVRFIPRQAISHLFLSPLFNTHSIPDFRVAKKPEPVAVVSFLAQMAVNQVGYVLLGKISISHQMGVIEKRLVQPTVLVRQHVGQSR